MSSEFSHLGVCVSDLERSLRFYCDGLGFERAEAHEIGDEFARLMDFEHVELQSQFIRRGSLAIELLAYRTPETLGSGERRALNQLGLTHLSFRVDDVVTVAARLEELGGQVVHETRTTMGVLDFVYCTDPDGTRIELMRLPG